MEINFKIEFALTNIENYIYGRSKGERHTRQVRANKHVTRNDTPRRQPSLFLQLL